MNARVDPSTKENAQPMTETNEEQGANAPKKKGNARRRLLMIAVPVVLVLGGGYFWLSGGRFEETDNAYVTQPIIDLSPDISGRVIEVDVVDNQTVKKGDVLFRIDPTPYKIDVNEAEATLANARVTVHKLKVAYTTAQAELASAKLTEEVRQREVERVNNLVAKGISSSADADTALLALQSAQATVKVDDQSVQSAIAALAGNPDIKVDDHPTVQAAIASLASAKRDLANTTVVAPEDGVISEAEDLNVGAYASTGTSIASLVATGRTWIEANFKENQLAKLKPGQVVDVSIDAYPGVALEGKIESIDAATGAEFSVIPAQNATGNWVKVVQRVPVRVVVSDYENAIPRTGMTAKVSVDTGKSRFDEMF